MFPDEIFCQITNNTTTKSVEPSPIVMFAKLINKLRKYWRKNLTKICISSSLNPIFRSTTSTDPVLETNRATYIWIHMLRLDLNIHLFH